MVTIIIYDYACQLGPYCIIRAPLLEYTVHGNYNYRRRYADCHISRGTPYS